MATSPSWQPDGSPLQVWRLVVHTTPISFMVSWQLGRRSVTRFTLQGVASPRVITHDTVEVGRGDWVRGGEFVLGPGFTRGREGDVRWELTWEPAAEEVWPTAQGVLRWLPWALQVLSFPRVRFVGQVQFGDETWAGEGWGALARWWGRSLPDRWFWANAPACGPNAGLEIWQAPLGWDGLPWPRLTVGYFWYFDGRRTVVWYQPSNGTLDLAGPPDNVRVRVLPWHGTGFLVTCRTHPRVWQKVGPDRILSLTGDARVLGGVACPSRVAIEWRRPPVW